MKIGITGSTGLIGWHLRAFLRRQGRIEVKGATRSTFTDRALLDQFVADVDVLVHLAGMNRGQDAQIEAVNVQLTEELIQACDRVHVVPHIVFSSSTHADRDTAYGRSKRRCRACLQSWADQHEGLFSNLVIPHVFGEFGKPFYNSVVCTFCHQFAYGETPRIIVDGNLELIHAQTLAERILQIVVDKQTGDVRIQGEPLRVGELLTRLGRMNALYRDQVVPALPDPLDVQFFNTLRSYLFPQFYPVSLQLREDERGGLFEAVRSLGGGQTFMSTTRPGVARGHHYHTRKIERFLVVEGEAVIRIRKLLADEVTEFRVTGHAPQYVDMPTFHTHSITNTGTSNLVTMFWANEIFNPQDADTYPEQVSP